MRGKYKLKFKIIIKKLSNCLISYCPHGNLKDTLSEVLHDAVTQLHKQRTL